MNFYKFDKEELEAILLFDYFDDTLHLSSNKQTVANRLIKKLGMPDKIDYIQGVPCSVEYIISMKDKNLLSKALNMSNYTVRYKK